MGKLCCHYLKSFIMNECAKFNYITHIVIDKNNIISYKNT